MYGDIVGLESDSLDRLIRIFMHCAPTSNPATAFDCGYWPIYNTLKIFKVYFMLFSCMDEYIYVTPRSRGYGDVTITYIRRSELPSHIVLDRKLMI